MQSQKRGSDCKRTAGAGATLSEERTHPRGFCSSSGLNHSRWVSVRRTGLGKVMTIFHRDLSFNKYSFDLGIQVELGGGFTLEGDNSI